MFPVPVLTNDNPAHTLSAAPSLNAMAPASLSHSHINAYSMNNYFRTVPMPYYSSGNLYYPAIPIHQNVVNHEYNYSLQSAPNIQSPYFFHSQISTVEDRKKENVKSNNDDYDDESTDTTFGDTQDLELSVATIESAYSTPPSNNSVNDSLATTFQSQEERVIQDMSTSLQTQLSLSQNDTPLSQQYDPDSAIADSYPPSSSELKSSRDSHARSVSTLQVGPLDNSRRMSVVSATSQKSSFTNTTENIGDNELNYKNLYIRGLSPSITDESLRRMCSK